MRYKLSFLLKAFATLVLMVAAKPALADYFALQGEMHFQSVPGDTCSTLSNGALHVVIVGRNDGPARGFEGFLLGEQLLHASIRGPNPAQLSLTFLGETAPSHAMQLHSTGAGAFAGQLQAKSLLGALYGCDFANAQIALSPLAGINQEVFERASTQMQLDARALQAATLGLQGKAKQAIPLLEQALATKEQSLDPNHPQLLPYLYFLAQLHFAEGSVPAAIPLDRRLVAICEKAYGAVSACSAAMLINLGAGLANAGQYVEADSVLRRALGMSDTVFGASSPMRGTALNGLGAVQISTGQYAEAEASLTQALALNKKWPKPDNANVGISLNNFGVLYRLTGQYKKSETAMRQAVAIDEKVLGADRPLTILNNVMLAQVLRVSGQYAVAEPIATRALAAAERILGPDRQDHPALAQAQICVAEIFRETGRFPNAETLYRKALDNSRKYLGVDHPQVAAIELLLAKLLHATGRDREALDLLDHANDVAHQSNNQTIAWQVSGELMHVYSSGKVANNFKAIFFGKQAVNELQKLRGNLSGSGSEAQESFVSSAEVSAIYKDLAALLLSVQRIPEAQQIVAMFKEQEYYEFTQRNSPADAPKTVAKLTSSEKQVEDIDSKYVGLGKEYGELKEKYQKQGESFSAADHSRLEELRKAMAAARGKFQASADEIAKSANDPEVQSRRRTEMNDYSGSFLGTLKTLGHHAVVAQYIVLDDRVAIILATPNVVVARASKITRADLYAQIRAFRTTLSSPDRDPLAQAQSLYQILVAPIAEDLRQAEAQTVMLELDDMLRYVPFAALHDGQHYLVESLSLAMVTEAARDKLGTAPKQEWRVWGLGVTEGGANYGPLPYANVELNGIAGQQGILNGKVLLDSAFTENALQNGLEQAYPIIHIASHFQFTPGSMQDSFLLLGDGSHLSLAAFKTHMDLNSVELLTLSACETAVGDESEGHGGEIEGLGAIAQQAGAKAVLATLWPVADSSTAALMKALYQAHKNDHLDKADALRHAQLALLQGSLAVTDDSKVHRGLARMGVTLSAQPAADFKVNPAARYAHPFFWAPFILMGNWL